MLDPWFGLSELTIQTIHQISKPILVEKGTSQTIHLSILLLIAVCFVLPWWKGKKTIVTFLSLKHPKWFRSRWI